mmetsp:Transcript_121078/g.387606  ORF Transcript_121078/g.387606 Transcript_121078/m.387606 type:complete len:102 (-) Transcript_121078:166-471(-)
MDNAADCPTFLPALPGLPELQAHEDRDSVHGVNNAVDFLTILPLLPALPHLQAHEDRAVVGGTSAIGCDGGGEAAGITDGEGSKASNADERSRIALPRLLD